MAFASGQTTGRLAVIVILILCFANSCLAKLRGSGRKMGLCYQFTAGEPGGGGVTVYMLECLYVEGH